MPETAQATFARMLRDEVAPALRAMGLKGSGVRFEIPSATHWAIVAFQRSTSSTRYRMRFTINVSIGSKAVWETSPWIGTKPSGNSFYGPNLLEFVRIGQFMGTDDHWWELGVGQSTSELASKVTTIIGLRVLPWLEAKIADGDRG